MKNLSNRLAWAREKKGWTQEQLAKKAGMSQSAIGNLEAGTRQTSRKIALLANVLGVDALWLSEGKGLPYGDNVDTPKSKVSLVYVDPDELELITAWREATDLGKEIIQDAAHSAPRTQLARDLTRHKS